MILAHCPALIYLDMDIEPGQIDKQKKVDNTPVLKPFTSMWWIIIL